MLLISCEISLMFSWWKSFFLVTDTVANQELTFTITDTKFYVPYVTLSTQDNVNYWNN